MGEKINSEKIFDWADIRRDIQSETPNLRDFIGDPYSEEEVARDLAKIERIKSGSNYKHNNGIGDSEIQEYATAQEIGEMDWFGEELQRDKLFPDDQGSDTCTFMTSEFDDHINHVDVICLMNNAYSDFQPVPFALDLTYNADVEGLDKKFHWRHPDKSIDSPGFCTVKYFEDTFNVEPILPRGRIAALPRFIVGFSPDLSERITEERMTNTGWGALSREEPSSKAKFCVLQELELQSSQMLEWLDKYRDINPELDQMFQNVTALNQFFGSALEAAKKHDPRGFQKYAAHDPVFQAIISRNIISG